MPTNIEKRYKHKFCCASGITYKKVNNKPIGLPKAQRHKDPFDMSRLRLKDNRYQIPTLRSVGLWIFQLGGKKLSQLYIKNECM